MRGKFPASTLFIERKEILVYPYVIVQLRMKGRNELVALSCGNDVSVDDGQRLGITVYLFDIWRADESHRNLTYALELSLCSEASELSPIGIAAHVDIHCRYPVEILAFHALCKQYETGTRTEDRQSVLNSFPYRTKQLKVLEQLQLRCRLSAGNYQSVFGLVPVRELPHLEAFRAKPLKHSLVLDERPLKG